LLGIPFGRVSTAEFLSRIGLRIATAAWKHVLLGLALAGCTLSGILAGSWLTGKYQPNWKTVTATQLVFSFNPGIYEELFFRGVVMMILLGATRSLRKAAIIQILLFGLMHLKAVDLAGLVEVVSVMMIGAGFWYTAYKTRCLLAGMAFHYVHDAFLFLPQLPGAEYSGFRDNALFYVGLWSMVGIGCLLTRLAADRLGARAGQELYRVE
jgi:membrane protease YdiL (CAAX protease family)